MRAIPDRSTCNALRGMWFVFQLDRHTFALWISSFSGKEEMYVDGTLVTAKRTIGFSSAHVFVVENTEYTVTLGTRELRKGRFECTLSRAGEIVQGFATEYLVTRSGMARVTTIVAAAVLTLLVLKTTSSLWYLGIGLAAIAGASIALSTRGKGYVIHEMPVPARSEP